MININITTELGAIIHSIDERVPTALRALESAILASCEPFVPYNTGELCNSGHASGDGNRGEVTWSANHASKCYYADREFNRKHHPHACARWFEAAKAIDGAKWANIAGSALTSSSSGKNRTVNAGGKIWTK